MFLNLPELSGKRFLIAGCGGGFDVFGGLPIADELSHRYPEESVVLANYSLHSKDFSVRQVAEEDYPEWYLPSEYPRYVFGKTGVQILRSAYQEIIDRHRIDTVILIDGGVDSLMRGDEEGSGTILEDTISILAAEGVRHVDTYLACLGFGTEVEEGLNHYAVLENIARLSSIGAFLGSCSLTKDSVVFSRYRKACLDAFSHGRESHIHSRIIPAVMGEFGEVQSGADACVTGASGARPWLNPLMGIYWFFDLVKVAEQSEYRFLSSSNTFIDAKMLFRQRMVKSTREKKVIPL